MRELTVAERLPELRDRLVDGTAGTDPVADAELLPPVPDPDYEAEVAFVVGRPCKDAATRDAVDAIAGYLLLNDLSARDLQFATLGPGDIVSTGTPSGVGSARKPGVWLKPGDEILVSSPTLGELPTALA